MIIKKLKLTLIFLFFFFVYHGVRAEVKGLNDFNTDFVNKGKDIGVISSKNSKYKNTDPIEFNADARRTRIQRKHGMVYKSIKDYILPEIKSEFASGFGRIAMFGKSKNKNCEADLFFNINSSTLFAVIYIDDYKVTRGFYLDHPYMKFSDILFQYKLTETNKVGRATKTAIVVDGEKNSFKIARNLNQIDFIFSNQDKVIEFCIFDLSLSKIYDGEQE